MAANLAILITARDEASKVMRGLAGETESFAGKALGAAKAASLGFAGLGAAMGGVALNLGADFEQTMSGVKAVSGASAEELKGLSGLALQLGKDTAFSAGESGKALEELVKGGVSIADIMGGAARSTLNLAAAGGVELAEAAEIAANSMSMFSLSGKDMENVANQIAGAANASSLSVGDFRYSMAAAGAVAATSGLSFESTAQAIAVMGSQGLKGSDAGTSLKSMLLALQPTTKAAIAAMTELGIVTEDGGNAFFDSEGKIKSMAAIADILKGSVEGLTEQERLMALETMFGSDAMRAAAVLANQGNDGFVAMAAGMNKVTAESVGMERLNNTRGSLEQLKGSAETAAISFGIAFQPALKKTADTLTAMVNEMIPIIETQGPALAAFLTDAEVRTAAYDAAGKALNDFLKEHSTVLAILSGIVAAGATAYTLATAASVAHSIATKATTIATTAMAAAQAALNIVLTANPIGIVIVVLAGLAAAFITAYNTSDDFRNAVDTGMAVIRGAIEGMWKVVKPILDTMGNVIGGIISTIQNLIDMAGRIPGVGGGSAGGGGQSAPEVPYTGEDWANAVKDADGNIISVPRVKIYGSGGFVSRPELAIVGDVPEYIIPASKMGAMGAGIDYDRLAAAIARQPIILQANGRELARLVREELLQSGRSNLSVGLA